MASTHTWLPPLRVRTKKLLQHSLNNTTLGKSYNEVNVDDAAEMITNSKEIIITPGYGMAVAKAQYPIAQMTKILQDNGVRVR